MRKRWLVFMLALVLILAACGSDTADETVETDNGEVSDSDEKVEISLAFWDIEEALAGGENDALLQAFEEKTNVKLIPQDMTSTDYHEKVQLWSTNGQLPDIFVGDFIGLGQSTFFDWVNQGIIRSLPEDLSDYPDLKAFLDNSDRAQQAKQNDEHYIIPRQSYDDLSWSVLDRNIVYRWDLAQEAGVTEEPETWDEFRDMILKIIENDAENKNIGGMAQHGLKSMAGYMYPYGGILEKKWVINEDGRALPSIFDGDLHEALKLSQDMYKEGTIIRDLTQIHTEDANNAFLQGHISAMCFNNGPASLWALGRDYNQLYEDREFLDDIKIAKIYPGYDGEKWYFVDTDAWSETYINANVDDEKMDAILRIFDFLHSEEGKLLMYAGIEGEDYEIVDGEIVLTEGVVLKEKYPFALASHLALQDPARWDKEFPSSIPDEYRQLNWERHEDAQENGVLPIMTDATMFLSTPLKDKFYYNPHDDYYSITMGADPAEDMVDSILEEYNAKGLEEMLDEVNALAKERGILE